MVLTRLAVLAVAATLMAGCRAGKTLPELGEVPRFSMTDQDGKPFTNDTVRGKVWAAAFVFTRCPTACPRVTSRMRREQEEAKTRGVDLRLVSISIDPDNDTPEVLRRYAAQFGADLSTWSFVTGDAKTVQATAEQGFKIAVEGSADPSRPDFGLTHGTQLVLVDRGGKIRGYYATSEEQPMKDLLDDAARLGR
jgi:protein SCO1/2